MPQHAITSSQCQIHRSPAHRSRKSIRTDAAKTIATRWNTSGAGMLDLRTSNRRPLTRKPFDPTLSPER